MRALPCHNRIASTPAKPMHLIKNIAEHLVHFLVMSKIYLSSLKERLWNHFGSSWIIVCNELPPALFSLSSDQIALAKLQIANNQIAIIGGGLYMSFLPLISDLKIFLQLLEWKHECNDIITCSEILKIVLKTY